MLDMSVLTYDICFLIMSTLLNICCFTHIHRVLNEVSCTMIKYSCCSSKYAHFSHDTLILWIYERGFIKNFMYFTVQNCA